MTPKKMNTLHNLVAAPRMMELEWVLDHRGAKQVRLSECFEAKRIKVRFLRQATRFCPPVACLLDQSRPKHDSTTDPVRPNEGNH